MTNLTEQLKKGELPDNHHYYYRLPNGTYEVGNTFCLETLCYCKGGDKIEVIDEVPSYEEWFNQGDYVAFLEEENTKLKELLKTHKLLFELEKDNTQNVLQRGKYAYFINDIDQVLDNNKIQADTVACNKIQEKNNGR